MFRFSPGCFFFFFPLCNDFKILALALFVVSIPYSPTSLSNLPLVFSVSHFLTPGGTHFTSICLTLLLEADTTIKLRWRDTLR